MSFNVSNVSNSYLSSTHEQSPMEFSDEEISDWFLSAASQGSELAEKFFDEKSLSAAIKGKALLNACLGGYYDYAKEGHKKIVTLLLNSQIQPIEAKDIGKALIDVVRSSNVVHGHDVVELILVHAKNRISADVRGKALAIAAKRGLDKMVNLLLDNIGDKLSSADILMAISEATHQYDAQRGHFHSDATDYYSRAIDSLYAKLDISKVEDPKRELQMICDLFKQKYTEIKESSK